MKVLLAPDKFKGSLTAAEVVHHLGKGLTERGIQYAGLPLADGGDGSVQAAIEAGFRRMRITVAGATGHERPTIAAFDGTTAVIEVANTCGLHTLPGGKLAPLDATSKGVGQAIVSLLRRNPEQDRAGPRRIGQHRRRSRHARRARRPLPRRHRQPDRDQ